MTSQSAGLSLKIKSSERYAAHLPMFVEVTLANRTRASSYYGLTPCNPWAPPFPVEFDFTGGPEKVTLPAQSDVALEEPGLGFNLSPGETRTWVLDLSELDTPIPLGTWHCTGRWMMRYEQPRSSVVSMRIVAGHTADTPLLGRLRLLGGARSPSWANLVEDREALETQELRGLSVESRRALIPYLIIHEAVHGPDPLSEFPTEHLSVHQQGPWASEAAVLRYELEWARQAKDLRELRSAVLASWPGVAYRLDEIDRGAGLLTAFRKRFGRESRE